MKQSEIIKKQREILSDVIIITDDLAGVEKGDKGICKGYAGQTKFKVEIKSNREKEQSYKANWIVDFEDVQFVNKEDIDKYKTYKQYLNDKNK